MFTNCLSVLWGSSDINLQDDLFCQQSAIYGILCYAMLHCSRYVLPGLNRAEKVRVTIFHMTLNMMQCRDLDQ
jgi:hypothetical protein